MDRTDGSAASSAPADWPGGRLQLTLSLGSIVAPLIAVATAHATGNPFSPVWTALCIGAGCLSAVTVQMVATRRARRSRLGVLGRIRLGRRSSRAACIDTKIKDPLDVQREARAAVRDVNRTGEDRDRAVHDLAHGPGSDDDSRWFLRSVIQDRSLHQDHRLAMAAKYHRCQPEAAAEALALFAFDSANHPFSRLEAAQLIADEAQRRLTTLGIATAAGIDAECRFKAAIALKPLALRDAQVALRMLATDAAVGFGVRFEAARHLAPIDRNAAVEVLWQMVGSEPQWIRRIDAAAELVVLRVREAYRVLLEWLENRELPEEAHRYLFATLSRLEAQRAA